MKTITFNDNNLTRKDIEYEVTKARAIMINDKDEIFISNYAGNYMLPGGAVEGLEDFIEALQREVKEETGIELNVNAIEPFLIIEQYIKNYPRRKTENDLMNRYMETEYYIYSTNEDINPNKMKLMENEIKANFKTTRVSLEQALALVEQSKTNDNPRNKYFSRELIAVVRELQRYLEKKEMEK